MFGVAALFLALFAVLPMIQLVEYVRLADWFEQRYVARALSLLNSDKLFYFACAGTTHISRCIDVISCSYRNRSALCV